MSKSTTTSLLDRSLSDLMILRSMNVLKIKGRTIKGVFLADYLVRHLHQLYSHRNGPDLLHLVSSFVEAKKLVADSLARRDRPFVSLSR